MQTEEKKSPEHICAGLLAHVDAGKTTLAEALLCEAGVLRKAGRVDRGDTLLDTHELERRRGITIFAGQAVFSAGGRQFTLLDTPGHVDFFAETERMLQVMDYGILVISGTDGVQAHTRTLWRLLALYRRPVFLFITKMDFARRSREDLMKELQRELSGGCLDFSPDREQERQEGLAVCREELLERYLAGKAPTEEETAELIRCREVFPCYFGSGLKQEGVGDFLQGLARFTRMPDYPAAFGARVFKINYDPQGNRLTHLKVTGGTLRVRDSVAYGGREEKINQIRIYTGEKYHPEEAVEAGGICTVLGLTETRAGQGLGREESAGKPLLEPVMEYRIVLPEGCDPQEMLPRLRKLEEEDPQLRLTWDGRLREIHVGLMGEVQAEILTSLIRERFDTEVSLDAGRVLYKETIVGPVEGVGHFEPLRHYAEVHLLLEPLERGSGLVLESRCSEDELERNWQRLILSHLQEKQHVGVLTGSPLTDVKITLTAGRAHLKHTEGGDFRQATWRAVRQGLRQAESLLLEPYYAFCLELPTEQVSRAMYDIRMRAGIFEAPETEGSLSLLRGTVPVAAFRQYAAELAAYTGGRGRLICEPAGYGPCHNADEVIRERGYNPDGDLENPADSVFCRQGSGFLVRWDRVPEYMHLPFSLKKEAVEKPAAQERTGASDEELEELMLREFGPIKRPVSRPAAVYTAPSSEPVQLALAPRQLIVDGYNVIYAWEELKALAEEDLGAAREQLLDLLAGYRASVGCDLTVVFDGYRVPGGPGEDRERDGMRVIYTKEGETADLFIERMARDLGEDSRVRVVTSDGLIQLSALRSGVTRMSAREFRAEAESVRAELRQQLEEINRREKRENRSTLGEHINSRKGEEK